MADDGRRFIPPGSCSWCGHAPHVDACGSTITALVDVTLGTNGGTREKPCPCARQEWADALDGASA